MIDSKSLKINMSLQKYNYIGIQDIKRAFKEHIMES
jgi:hypothetical protein